MSTDVFFHAEFKSQKASDIISTLVGMYDSRETIVIELQQWLAKRLLIAQDYEVDAEVCSFALQGRMVALTLTASCHLDHGN